MAPKEDAVAASGEPTRVGGGGAGAGPNTDEAAGAGIKGDVITDAGEPKRTPPAGGPPKGEEEGAAWRAYSRTFTEHMGIVEQGVTAALQSAGGKNAHGKQQRHSTGCKKAQRYGLMGVDDHWTSGLKVEAVRCYYFSSR